MRPWKRWTAPKLLWKMTETMLYKMITTEAFSTKQYNCDFLFLLEFCFT